MNFKYAVTLSNSLNDSKAIYAFNSDELWEWLSKYEQFDKDFETKTVEIPNTKVTFDGNQSLAISINKTNYVSKKALSLLYIQEYPVFINHPDITVLREGLIDNEEFDKILSDFDNQNVYHGLM